MPPRPIRICVVTSGPLGSNPRVVKEAQALHDAGYEVTVISTRTLAHVDERDEDVLAGAGWSAQRLDFRARGPQWRLRRAIQMAHAGAFSAAGFPYFAERGFSAFTKPLTAAAASVEADLYIAHYPPALPAAAAAARLHNSLYAFDAEDFHQGDWPDGREYEQRRSLVRAIEARYLPGCAYVTAASPGIADAYAESYGIARPTVLLNVFSRSRAPAGPTFTGTMEPGPSLYWFSQTIGPGRGLECAVQGTSRARTRPHLYLRGNPAPGFLDRLLAIAADKGSTTQLHILPPALPSEMEQLAARFDVGLVCETGNTTGRRVALTNKQFSYLLAGVPAVLSDIAAHTTFAPEASSAVRVYSVDDADSLAAAIDSLLSSPEALANARAEAFRLGQERFNWDLEKQKLLDLIGGVMVAGAVFIRKGGTGEYTAHS